MVAVLVGGNDIEDSKDHEYVQREGRGGQLSESIYRPLACVSECCAR